MRAPSSSSVAAAVLALLVAACAGGEPAPPADPASAPAAAERSVQVRVVTLAPRAVVERASLPADLLPARRAVLAAEVGGVVEAVEVEIGQWVERGRLLARIDERSLAQQVAEAEAWLRQARLQHERAENLFERKAVTKADLLDAVTNRDVAEARLATVKLQLEKSRVRAPWSGRVAGKRVEAGDFVSPGTPLFELVDSSHLIVRAPARSADVRYLERGREVEVTVDAYPGETFAGRIERLGAELDPSTRTLAVEADIANPDGRLKPGMLARLEVPRRTLAAALVVPQGAVVDLEGGKAVYVVEDGRAARRRVELGPLVGEEVVVEGLAAGDRVIVEGLQAVAEGQPVEEIGA